MARKPRVAVHIDEKWTRLSHYQIYWLAKAWSARGIDVEFIPGCYRFVEVDVAFSHVDRTITPEKYRCLVDHYPIVLNARVTDISKRAFSRHVVDRDSDWSGAVVVKSNENTGGMPERRIRMESFGLAQKAWWKIHKRLPWQWTGLMTKDRYGVIATLEQVPPIAWRSPGLVVERFMPERRNDHYIVRHWFFLGDAEFDYFRRATHPIVRGKRVVEWEISDMVPEPVRELRRQLGFDYGSFDFAISEQGPVVF